MVAPTKMDFFDTLKKMTCKSRSFQAVEKPLFCVKQDRGLVRIGDK